MNIVSVVSDAQSADRFSLKGQARCGMVWVAVLFILVVVWGGLAQISGAVVASGRVTLESSIKRIQHREGGIVSEILVGEGQTVKAGQVLVRLDPTVVNANEAIIQDQIWQLSARKARLEAERDHLSPAAILIPTDATDKYRTILMAERKLMVSRFNLRAQQKGQLKEQQIQGQHQIVGLQAQIDAVTHQSELIKTELVAVRDLNRKGYAPFTRVSELQRQADQLDGQCGELMASIARTKAEGAQIGQQLLQVDSQALGEIMNDLKETDTKLSQLLEQEVTARDQSERVEIKTPVTGKVQQLLVHTKGGVLSPGETIMMIVPQSENLVVEARIDPTKRDDVVSGQRAHLKFTAFDTRTSPDLVGRVDTISSDVETDDKTGKSTYRARLTLDGMKVPANMRDKLVAGMPVEVQIETRSRNAIGYFLKPLTDQLNRTFREE
jgi:HlyD family secretion protein